MFRAALRPKAFTKGAKVVPEHIPGSLRWASPTVHFAWVWPFSASFAAAPTPFCSGVWPEPAAVALIKPEPVCPPGPRSSGPYHPVCPTRGPEAIPGGPRCNAKSCAPERRPNRWPTPSSMFRCAWNWGPQRADPRHRRLPGSGAGAPRAGPDAGPSRPLHRHGWLGGCLVLAGSNQMKRDRAAIQAADEEAERRWRRQQLLAARIKEEKVPFTAPRRPLVPPQPAGSAPQHPG